MFPCTQILIEESKERLNHNFLVVAEKCVETVFEEIVEVNMILERILTFLLLQTAHSKYKLYVFVFYEIQFEKRTSSLIGVFDQLCFTQQILTNEYCIV